MPIHRNLHYKVYKDPYLTTRFRNRPLIKIAPLHIFDAIQQHSTLLQQTQPSSRTTMTTTPHDLPSNSHNLNSKPYTPPPNLPRPSSPHALTHNIPTINPAAPITNAPAFTPFVAIGAAPALLEADETTVLEAPAATEGLAPPPDAPPSPPSPPSSPPPVAGTLDVAAAEAPVELEVESEPELAWRGRRSRFRRTG